MLRKNFASRRDIRRADSEERANEYATLSLEARLLQLDSRPGASTRQRARLATLIEQRDNPVKLKPEPKKKREPARTDKKARKAVKKKDSA